MCDGIGQLKTCVCKLQRTRMSRFGASSRHGADAVAGLLAGFVLFLSAPRSIPGTPTTIYTVTNTNDSPIFTSTPVTIATQDVRTMLVGHDNKKVWT